MTADFPADDPASTGRLAELSALAAHLAEVVASHRTRTVELEVLYRAAVAFDRSLATAVHGRADLAEALTELHRAQLVTLPRGRVHFDRRAEPALPMWVRRPAPARPDPVPTSGRVWPSALQPAARLARRPDELAVLETVAAFLRRGGADRLSIPVRERSLELFGDEKRLDALSGTRLFASEALTLQLLRCHPVPLPLAAQWVPGVEQTPVTLLVAENHHTYASLLNATRAHAAAGGPARHVGYGAGQQFCSSVASITMLEPRPERVVYFGDLDMRGLEIPKTAAATAEALGLPPVEPALPLYAALLNRDRRGPVPPVTPEQAAAVTSWLGPLAAQAAELITGGHRMAQEAVNLELLLQRPQWLDQL